jgi:hypothetical protein
MNELSSQSMGIVSAKIKAAVLCLVEADRQKPTSALGFGF